MSNTHAWRFQVWVSFALSMGITSLGVYFLPVAFWPKAFIGVGFLFTVAQAFTLAKTIRDDQERSRYETDRPYREAGIGR